jgi:hypothetical protein
MRVTRGGWGQLKFASLAERVIAARRSDDTHCGRYAAVVMHSNECENQPAFAAARVKHIAHASTGKEERQPLRG